MYIHIKYVWIVMDCVFNSVYIHIKIIYRYIIYTYTYTGREFVLGLFQRYCQILAFALSAGIRIRDCKSYGESCVSQAWGGQTFEQVL